MRRAGVIALALTVPSAAAAHTATSSSPSYPAPEPWMLVPLVLAGLAYGVGYARLRKRSGPGREALARRGAVFALGFALLAGATLSPLHALGGRSFTAHMIEHELIMLAAAPLLVWSRPLGVMIWAFPTGGRQGLAGIPRSPVGGSLWTIFTEPMLATALQAAALWIWHLPSLFDRALGSEVWHAAQHLSFFVTALLFWSAMLGPRRNPWTTAACLFATSMITGALGAFMAVSQSPWYGPYAALGLAALGLTPSEDQQLAGVLMWVPGGLLHAIIAIAILAPHLRGHSLKAASHG